MKRQPKPRREELGISELMREAEETAHDNFFGKGPSREFKPGYYQVRAKKQQKIRENQY